MLDAIAVAGVFRNAAIELEELAGSAPAYELGTLRRKMRAVVPTDPRVELTRR
jgi:hypothetical protein